MNDGIIISRVSLTFIKSSVSTALPFSCTSGTVARIQNRRIAARISRTVGATGR